MSDGETPGRREAKEPSRWWIFIGASLLLHLGMFYQSQWLRLAMERWSNSMPGWMQEVVKTQFPKDETPAEQPKAPEEEPEVEMNLSFVEVDPLAVTQDAPEKTPLYSTVNSLAGNPEPPEKPTDKPKFDGRQEVMIRTFDNPRPPEVPLLKPDPAPGPVVPEPLAPTPVAVQALPEVDRAKVMDPLTPPLALQPKPEPKVEPKPKPEVKAEAKPVPPPPEEPEPKPEMAKKPQEKPQTPESGPKPGDLAMARPSPRAVVEAPTPTPAQPLPVSPPTLAVVGAESRPLVEETPRPKRPRTLSQARAQKGILAGEKMRQEGGVSRLSIVPSLDVKASPFGSYDGHMIFAIQQRWYRLLDDNHYALERVGKVVVRFVLNADGSITQLRRIQTDVGETLGFICESAIIEPAPYEPWPSEMRKAVGADTRELTFTFYYN